MDSKKLEKLIIKYLSKIISKKEWEELNSWFEESGDSNLFKDYLKINYAIESIMNEFDKEKKKKLVLNKIKKDKTIVRRHKRLNYLKYAAVAAIIFGISFYTLQTNKVEIKGANSIEVVESGSNKAILTLENGDQVSLEKGKNFKSERLVSNGEELVYNSEKKKKATAKLEYNYLTIPRGGQFFLKLSDGTKVWVNSDSKLKYPTSFIKNQVREVELVYGEAYFEVSPSDLHNGASFNVATREQEINVLGTEFNIRAYRNDAEIITTLAGGKIVIEKDNLRKVLRPDQQSIVNSNSTQINIREVDAKNMTSWVRGLFIFEEESLDKMLEDLSRWYDVEVFFETQQLKEIPFTGVLERTKSLNDILKVIEGISDNAVKFEIKNKILMVK